MNLVATRSGDLACPWPWTDLESYPVVTFSSLSAVIWFARKPRLAFAQIYFKIFIGKQELEERAAEACQSPYVFPLVTIPFNCFDEIFTKNSHKMQDVWMSNGGDQRWAFPSVPVSFRTLSSQILPVSWILTLLFTPFPNTTFFFFFFCYIPEIICDLALCVFGLCKVESYGLCFLWLTFSTQMFYLGIYLVVVCHCHKFLFITVWS